MGPKAQNLLIPMPQQGKLHGNVCLNRSLLDVLVDASGAVQKF